MNDFLETLGDIFQVGVTLLLVSIAAEFVRPGTYTSSFDLVSVLVALIIIGAVLVVKLVSLSGVTFMLVDIFLLAVILLVVPGVSALSRFVSVVCVVAVALVYFRNHK